MVTLKKLPKWAKTGETFVGTESPEIQDGFIWTGLKRISAGEGNALVFVSGCGRKVEWRIVKAPKFYENKRILTHEGQ